MWFIVVYSGQRVYKHHKAVRPMEWSTLVRKDLNTRKHFRPWKLSIVVRDDPNTTGTRDMSYDRSGLFLSGRN